MRVVVVVVVVAVVLVAVVAAAVDNDISDVNNKTTMLGRKIRENTVQYCTVGTDCKVTPSVTRSLMFHGSMCLAQSH
jgi:cell division protein FtsL